MFHSLDSRRRGAAAYLRGILAMYLGFTGDQGGGERLQVLGGGYFSGILRAAGATLTGALAGTTAAFSGALSGVTAAFTGAITAGSAAIGSITGTTVALTGSLSLSGNISQGGMVRRVLNNKAVTHGVNSNLFTLVNDYNGAFGGTSAQACVRVRVWLYNTDVQAFYATSFGEYFWRVGGTGGGDFSDIFTIYSKNDQSGVSIGVSIALTSNHSGDAEVLGITPTISGAGSSQGFVWVEAEVMGAGITLAAA